MMVIPGFIISLLTFPGVIVHEVAHQLFCRLGKIPVFDVKYFQIDANVAGYVQHGEIESFGTAFLVSFGPLFVNTLLCLLICLPASLPYQVFGDRGPVTYALLWLGVSIGMHAFPSNQDAAQVWSKAKSAAKSGNLLAIASFPIVILIRVANLARFFWFDAIYGFSIGVLLPTLVLRF
jgi:hypothetical protein